MSQFTLTAEEDAIVIDALRSKANEYQTLYGALDPTLEALVAKVASQFSVPAAVEEAPAPKAKKSKAATSEE
jgi:hypothetical protein